MARQIVENILLLKITNLNYTLAQNQVIKDFNLALKKGQIITLFGPSGCGKTTLLKIIAGIIETSRSSVQNYAKKIGYLFQEHRLFQCISALENIMLVTNKTKKDWVISELESVGLLEKDYKKYPKELSGGMCARVAFIRTMAYGGELLLLDEPFSGLDFLTKKILMQKILYQVENHGISVILVTHDAYEACLLSHEIYLLSHRLMQIEKFLPISIPHTLRNEEAIQSIIKKEFANRLYFD